MLTIPDGEELPDAGAELRPIRDKLARGARLDRADGLLLDAASDLLGLGRLAAWAVRRRHGRAVSYVRNCHLNYSNRCVLGCAFCAFHRRPEDPRPGGYELTVEEILAAAGRGAAAGAREAHITGGLHPTLPFRFYTDLLSGLRSAYPGLGRKCFTAVEVYHLARRARLSPRETLLALREAGLEILTGGGAEVLDDAVRARLCPGKESAAEWLDLHRTAHQLGLRSNATLLHGHLETAAQRIEHLIRLRELQDETGGFLAFVPLPYHPAGEAPAVAHGPDAPARLRLVASARLLLDNFPHVKAYWVAQGVGIAQMALCFGASDLDGTVRRERIFHAAGAEAPEELEPAQLERLIRETGGAPWERDHLYRPVRRGE